MAPHHSPPGCWSSGEGVRDMTAISRGLELTERERSILSPHVCGWTCGMRSLPESVVKRQQLVRWFRGGFFPRRMSSNESLVRLRRRGFAPGCSAAVTSRVVFVESASTAPGWCLEVGVDAGDANAADAANDPTGCRSPVQRTRLSLRLVAFCEQSRGCGFGCREAAAGIGSRPVDIQIRSDWIRRGSCQCEAVLSPGAMGCDSDRTADAW